MLERRDGQAAMAVALLDSTCPSPANVLDARRFAVHRNNVTAGLVETLGATFPAVRALVGDAFFKAAACEFLRAHPPDSPVLICWGNRFPDWLAAFPPAASLPYLPDVARVEWAWAEAYNAQDAVPIAASALASLSPDLLLETCLALHPSLRIVSSSYAVVSLWAEVTGRAARSPFNLNRPQNAVVVRPAVEVVVSPVPPATAIFLAHLAAGQRLGKAAEVGAMYQDFDLAAQIAALFERGLVTGVTIKKME